VTPLNCFEKKPHARRPQLCPGVNHGRKQAGLAMLCSKPEPSNKPLDELINIFFQKQRTKSKE
jgi:hypothetical protein